MNFDPQKDRTLTIHMDIHNQRKAAWLRTEGGLLANEMDSV